MAQEGEKHKADHNTGLVFAVAYGLRELDKHGKICQRCQKSMHS